jgi:hypothetical protein
MWNWKHWTRSWAYENLEPSKPGLLMTRVGGVVGAIASMAFLAFVVLVFYSDDSFVHWRLSRWLLESRGL